jgi:glucose/arabinose dehydrogenase
MHTTALSSLSLVLLAAACSGAGESTRSPAPQAQAVPEASSPAAPSQDCTPLETRPPEEPSQRPAFPGQTRACGVRSNVAFDVTVVARGLEHPWSVEPLPGGGLLVTERPGRMRQVAADGTLGQPITGIPPVVARGQGGLLDIALSPTFASDRTIFWSFSEPREGGNATSVARGVLSADGSSVSDVRVILRTLPAYDGGAHFGSRLAFGPDGMLYVTTGDRSDARMRHHAQETDNHLGKVLRIAPDGSAPQDNPFVGQANAKPEVWTLGHRNIQASAFDAQGTLWTIEHGTRGGDELNRIEKGKNYGWPVQAYGIEYRGQAIAGSSTAPAGLEQPVYYWDPVIAPSGAQFYTGDAFPAWRGSLFIGGMKATRLVLLTLENGRVTGEEHLLAERGKRIRDVRQGPDGALYLVTDEDDGEVWRIAPRR